MTTFLVATASVHTTAAACDYLQTRVDAGDTVLVVALREPAVDDRDAGDAVNVARTRLVEPNVETITGEGDVTATVRDLVGEHDVDELVIGSRRGDPEATPGLGGTAADLLVSLDVPVVVVPLQEL